MGERVLVGADPRLGEYEPLEILGSAERRRKQGEKVGHVVGTSVRHRLESGTRVTGS